MIGKIRKPGIDAIKARIANELCVSVGELDSARGTKRLCDARHLAMFVCIELGYTLSHIGMSFGGRDHTTVINARRRVLARMQGDVIYRASVAVLIAEIKLEAAA
jgi:chromosomal replication initiator protein